MGRAGIRRRRDGERAGGRARSASRGSTRGRPTAQAGPTATRPETSKQRDRRLARRAWTWTWLWPVPALGVLLAGGMATERFPAGTAKETVLLGALVALAMPGAVAGVVEAVRRARRPVEERLAEQAEREQARGRPLPRLPSTRLGPPGLVDELGGWALGWGFAQALLGIGLGVLVKVLPVAEDWETLPLIAGLLGLLLPMLLLLGGLLFGAVALLRIGLGAMDLDGRPGQGPAEVLLRALVLSLGLCLLGLATFGVPFAVASQGDVDLPRGSLLALGQYAFSDVDAAPGWVLALRATSALIYAGLLGVVVATPLLLAAAVRGASGPAARSTGHAPQDAPDVAGPAAEAGEPAPDAAGHAADAAGRAPDAADRAPDAPRAVPRAAPNARAQGRIRRHLRRQAVDCTEAQRLATRRAAQALAITVVGAALALAVAAWLAAVTERDHVVWTLLTGGRGGGTLSQVAVSRADLVPFALGLAGPPALLAAVGWFLTRRSTSRESAWPGPRVSDVSLAGAVLTVALVPGVVGCYLVSHWVGPTSDLGLLPGAWAQLAFFGTMLGAVGWWGRRRPRRGRPRRRR